MSSSVTVYPRTMTTNLAAGHENMHVTSDDKHTLRNLLWKGDRLLDSVRAWLDRALDSCIDVFPSQRSWGMKGHRGQDIRFQTEIKLFMKQLDKAKLHCNICIGAVLCHER